MIVDWPSLRFKADSEEALQPLAQVLAAECPRPLSRIDLRGSLGAGKTSFARALLRALGVSGRIKSPSFAVVESYEAGGPTVFPIHHLDLYRLHDPRAWRAAGLRELFQGEGLTLVEWPEKAEGLPPPDLDIQVDWADPNQPEGPRILTLRSAHGGLIQALSEQLERSSPDNPQRRSLVLSAGGALLLGLLPSQSEAISVVAVRVWPADEYTRVAIEHDTEGLSFKTQRLTGPDRLVVDIEGMRLSPALRDLVARIAPNDPYISTVRVGQYQPEVVRLVFDLRQAARPEVFRLPPIAQYQHRLVIDLFPEVEVDPLLRFLQSIEDQRAADALAGKGEPFRADEALAESTPTTPPGGAGKPTAPQSPPSTPEAPQKGQKPAVRRLVTVALDAGHGGEDPGAIGRRGTREKDVVLKIAKLLKREIDAIDGMRAYLTRDGDYFVPLWKRVEKARRVRADLFVSIHADAWVSPTARGSSVYVLSQRGATSAAARWMANKENESDKIGGFQLAHGDKQLAETLGDMLTTAQIRDSIKLAKAVLGEIGDINRLHKRQVEQAGFAVLKAPEIPSILVETAFISNPEEEQRLRDEDYQRDMAKALLRGIRSYLAKYPPQSRSGLL